MNRENADSLVLDSGLQRKVDCIEEALIRFLPSESQHPAVLHEAMNYAVLNGGKRIRPLLALSVCELFGDHQEEALIPACAIEMIHCYSLIHDDLPCLDNDEYRRGQLTCHKKFGEAMALLTGDGLLTLAFHLIGTLKDAKKAQRILSELSHAAGTFGMVGGQVMDHLSEGIEIDLPTLDAIHINKTGQLIKVSCLIGAIMGDAQQREESRILKFGEYLGFAFQIVDDILDGDGYLRFMSVHEAREKAAGVIAKARQEISGFPKNNNLLQISDLILGRGGQEGQPSSTREHIYR